MYFTLTILQVRISLQIDNHASTPPLKFFTGRMPFLPPNQQRQSTEGINININDINQITQLTKIHKVDEMLTIKGLLKMLKYNHTHFSSH